MTTSPVQLKDKYGNDLFLENGGDIRMPAFPAVPDFRQHVVDIREMELKPHDVIIVGFAKTGSHWNFEIVNMLLQGKSEYFKGTSGQCFMDFQPVSALPRPSDDEPRVLYTHVKCHHLPKQVWEKKVKIIYLERNPKDTWVSRYNHAISHRGQMAYDGTWDQFFDLMMSSDHRYGDWFDYVQDWERAIERETDLSIFTSTFEDLKRDPVGQIEKMDQFLGTNRGRELCEKIAEACKFTSLKAAKGSDIPDHMKPHFKENATVFYRKGQIGDWKNWFTVAQNERFDAVYEKRMAGSKLRYTFVE